MKRKHAITTLLLIFTSLPIFAHYPTSTLKKQDSTKHIESDFLVTLKNDTLYGEIKREFTKNYTFYEKIFFHPLPIVDSLYKEYKPNIVKAFFDSKANIQYRRVYYNNNYYFAKKILDGYLKLFVIVTELAGDGTRTVLFIRKTRGKLIRVKEIGFRKQMTEYFKDCKEVAGKIWGKEYKFIDIETVIEHYNESCGK